MRHTCVAMHLILALSVIILHHVDSYSCRSIIKKLDDINLKSVEDSSESYEVRNDEIVQILHPFMKAGQARSRKYQPLHNNLAKLTLEPYLERNRTHHWQTNPYSRFNKRKSIGPLAIILTHLPELKKQKSENNNLYSSSSINNKNTQYHPIETNIQKLPDKIVKVKTDAEEEIVSNTEESKQIPFETSLNNNVVTLKAGTSEVPTDFLTISQDFVLTDDQRSNDLDNKEMHVDYNKGQKQIKSKTGQNMDENSTIQNIKLLKTVESNRDKSAVDDYSVDSAYLSDKDRSDNADDKIQDDMILFSSVEPNSIAPKTELGQELDVQHEDIVITGRDTTKDSSEIDPDKLKAENVGEKNGQLITDIRNADELILEPKEPQNREDVTESSLTYFQIPLDSFEQYTDLESREGTGKEDGMADARQDHSHNYEDHTGPELDEKLSEEYLTENSNGNQHRSLYNVDDSYEKEKDLSEERLEQNALISSLNYVLDRQEHTLETDKEIKNENPTEHSVEIKDKKKNSYTSEVTNKGPEYWYHDIGNWHHFHPQNIYNLCFHFKR